MYMYGVLYSYFVDISKQLSVSFCAMQCCSSVIGVTWNSQDSIVSKSRYYKERQVDRKKRKAIRW